MGQGAGRSSAPDIVRCQKVFARCIEKAAFKRGRGRMRDGMKHHVQAAAKGSVAANVLVEQLLYLGILRHITAGSHQLPARAGSAVCSTSDRARYCSLLGSRLDEAFQARQKPWPLTSHQHAGPGCMPCLCNRPCQRILVGHPHHNPDAPCQPCCLVSSKQNDRKSLPSIAAYIKGEHYLQRPLNNAHAQFK